MASPAQVAATSSGGLNGSDAKVWDVQGSNLFW